MSAFDDLLASLQSQLDGVTSVVEEFTQKQTDLQDQIAAIQAMNNN